MESNTLKKVVIGITAAVLLTIGIVTVVVLRSNAKQQKKIDESNPYSEPTTKEEIAQQNFPLKKGSKGNRVKNVQMALNIAPTGDFDQATENAVYEFSLKLNKPTKVVTEANYNYYVGLIKKYGGNTQF